MAINWGEATRIGLVGMGVTFAVLIILAVAIWLTGLIIRKIGGNKTEAAPAKNSGPSKT